MRVSALLFACLAVLLVPGTALARTRAQAQPAAGSPEPVLSRIRAVFVASTKPGCSPPACTTYYTEKAKGQGLKYVWAVSIPEDEGCADGFHGNTPKPNQASWYHADETEGGPCDHRYYDALGEGHPGVVTVEVSNAHWTCIAVFHGTQASNGTPAGTGPKPGPCTPTSAKH